MNCTRCGAGLPDSAQVCPMCGMPRQQMTPVSSPLSSQAQMSSTSVPLQSMATVPATPVVPSVPAAAPMMQSASPYLPAGIPAWPTTAAIPMNMHLPAPGTPSAPTPYAPGATKAKRPARASLSARSILVGLAFIILVPLIGAGITYGSLYLNGQVQSHSPQKSLAISKIPTPQPSTAAGTGATPTTGATDSLPTPTSFVTMSNSSQKLLGVLIKYPQGWQEQPGSQQSDGSFAVDIHPQQQLGIIMLISRFPATSGTTTDVNQSEIQGLSNVSGVTNLQMVQSASSQQAIGGAKWDEQDATFDSNSVTYHMVSVAVKHGSYFFNILYSSPDMYYSEAVQKYMQPMLSSFKFLA